MEKTVLVRKNDNPLDPDGPERRMAILDRNREHAEHIVSQATDKDTVILLIDERELDGKAIAQLNHQDWIVQCEKDSVIPTLVMAASRWTIYKALRRLQTALHKQDSRNAKRSSIVETLAQPAPAGSFHAIVISKGKQLVTWPIPQ